MHALNHRQDRRGLGAGESLGRRDSALRELPADFVRSTMEAVRGDVPARVEQYAASILRAMLWDRIMVVPLAVVGFVHALFASLSFRH